MSCGIMIGIYVAEHCNNIIIINTRLFPCQNRTRETRDLFSKIMKKKKVTSHLSITLVADRDYRGTISVVKSRKIRAETRIICYHRVQKKSYADRIIYPA